MITGTVQINSYAVVAIAVVLGVLWIAAMVFYNTHVIIKITTRRDIFGHLGWYHKETRIAIGSANEEEDRIVISVGELETCTASLNFDKADKAFLSMIHGRVLRGQDKAERTVLMRRQYLPEKVQTYIDDHRRSLASWV